MVNYWKFFINLYRLQKTDKMPMTDHYNFIKIKLIKNFFSQFIQLFIHLGKDLWRKT